MATQTAKRDPNRVTTLIGVDSDTFELPTTIAVDPTTHELLIKGSITVSTTGLATSGKQDTGNTSLSNIDGKLPALGQALAASSIPVILPTATISTLTPPAAITGFATETTLALIKNTDGIKKIADPLPVGTNVIGAVKRDVINYTGINKYYAYTGAVTDGIVWSPAGGKKVVITDIAMSISAAATVTLEWDKTGGDEAIMAFDLAANGGVSTNLQTPLACSEADADLIITTSAGNVKIAVVGYEI